MITLKIAAKANWISLPRAKIRNNVLRSMQLIEIEGDLPMDKSSILKGLSTVNIQRVKYGKKEIIGIILCQKTSK